MILDVILKDDAYILKIHKKFFNNVSTPLALFQTNNPLMQKYSYLGIFQIDGPTFGFDGCFKKQSEDGEYVIYKFDFLTLDNNSLVIRKMIQTLYISTYYVVEQMYYNKEFFSDSIWKNQSLSFVVFNGGENRSGYAFGGQIFPWFKIKLNSLSEENILNLNKYVTSELNRIYNYFNREDIPYSQVTIEKESFFIQVNMGGRWISWKKSRDLEKQEDFNSHNIDFRSDQELCFAAIVAINTWLREN
ncbi:MAG TPA: hypothetical protein VIK86_09275 [Candidatus Paceibacterota bacterium]